MPGEGVGRALVTGATGFVGRALVEELRRHGARVTCVVRRPEQARRLEARGLEALVADLTRPETLAAVAEGPAVDRVFHVAGVLTARRRAEFEAVNVAGTQNLYRALLSANRAPKRIVHVSSIAAGGPAAGPRPRREDDPDAPVSLYGRTKRAGEAVARAAMARVPVTIVRPCVVYGPADPNALPVYRMAARGLVLRPPGQPKHFSMVHVDDLARLLVRVSEAPAAAGELYNVATGPPCSWDEMVELIAAAVGRPCRQVGFGRAPFWAAAHVNALRARLRPGAPPDLLIPQKLPEVYARYWQADTTKLREALGNPGATGLAEGIRETADWYRQEGWL